ncbi:MAG TPA: anti-sigma factor [Opitutaceae bacterium]|nr:anti-sigma factor [Opitutaceae bacterium]
MPSDLPAEPKAVSFHFPAWVPWTALAAAVLALAWAALQWMTLRTELATLRIELQLAQLDLKDAQQRREADRILGQYRRDPATLKIFLLSSPHAGSPSALAAVAWNPGTSEGVLVAQNLPPPAPGQVYRLWAIDPQHPHPVVAGVIDVDPQTGAAHGQFKPSQPLPAAARFQVSLERQGGVPAPEGPVVLASP